MRRYWIDKNLIQNELVQFKDDVFHHIFDVCRQEVGNHFEVLTDDSKAYLVEVLSVQKKTATGKIKEERVISELKKPFINLCVSIPKFSTLELILEKSVELGVHQVLPFYSDFSFVKSMDEKEWAHKSQRWQKIIKSATQQSGRGSLMNLEKPEKFNLILKKMNQNPNDMSLFLYEGETNIDIKSYLQQQKELKNQPIENAWIFIGSEGGFSFKEINELQTLGLSPATLGEQILRVETACLMAVSVLKYELDLWG